MLIRAIKVGFLIFALQLLSGCYPTSLADQQKDINAAQGEASNLSVGTVQKEIKVGMSSADVVSVLGSPNMITTDDKRREVWVYEKVSTEGMATTSQGQGFLWYPSNRNAIASRTQKTLTIVIKLDEKGRVRDFAYNQTKF
ncbi:hypothetical protein AOC19_05420 [Polynucleobacter asymbioticus]|uniref:hypothetical protein n=1 Tax=Polynucleobacter asymbioticus TaxID=576611 RepID=UPI001BFD0D60|nr:hypothetical protein [Polynucleobacter asymbioticus]QWD84612.1 hypothetical protein AOC19_05420 [Polynucleobacter asymbioticus]